MSYTWSLRNWPFSELISLVLATLTALSLARGHQTRFCREEPGHRPTPVLKPLGASRQLFNLLGLAVLHWGLKSLCEVTTLRHLLSWAPSPLSVLSPGKHLLSVYTGASSVPTHCLPQGELRGQCDVNAMTEAQEGAMSMAQGFPGRWHWLRSRL